MRKLNQFNSGKISVETRKNLRKKQFELKLITI